MSSFDLTAEERTELDGYIDAVLDAHKRGKIVTPVARGEMAGLVIMTALGKTKLLGWVRTGAGRVGAGV